VGYEFAAVLCVESTKLRDGPDFQTCGGSFLAHCHFYGAPYLYTGLSYRVSRHCLYPLLRMGVQFVAESGQNGQITYGAGSPTRNSRPGRDPDFAGRGSE
jgi:hypothetical protein